MAAVADQARYGASRGVVAPERSRAHEADAGYDRSRVSNGQNAHRHLHAEQRSFPNELWYPRRREVQHASRLDPQRTGVEARGNVPEDQRISLAAVCVSGWPAEGNR